MGYQERLKIVLSEIIEQRAAGKSKRGGSGKESSSSKSGKAKEATKVKSMDDEKKQEAEARVFAELELDLPAQPSFRNTLLFTVFAAPLTISYATYFGVKWVIDFRVLGKEYGEEEKAYLTKKICDIDDASWARMSAEDREELMALLTYRCTFPLLVLVA